MAAVRSPFFRMFIICIACSLSAASGTAPPDSSRYGELRRQLSTGGASPALLETADALAKEGLYEEAIEILETFAEKASPEAAVTESPRSERIEKRWRVSAGADYYRLEDIDTAVMTPEEYRDYQRLTQTPLSFWGRGKCAVNFNGGILEQIAPEVYLSNYRSSFEVPARLNFAEDRLLLETVVKAGKWFQADAAGPWKFKPTRSYPSDMEGLSARIATQSAADDGRKWSWATPVLVDWEHYREDRIGYESFVGLRFNPALEYRSGGGASFFTRFGGEVNYETYYRSQSDTLEVVRGMAQIDNSLRPGTWYLLSKLEWLVDRYINATAPGRIDRWKAALRAEQGSKNLLSPRLAAQVLHEREQYFATATAKKLMLPGTGVRITPALRLNVLKSLYFEPELSYERRWSDRVGNLYLWQALSRSEALLRGALSLEWLDAALFIGYRGEDVAAGFERFTDDSRSFLLGADATVSFGARFSVNMLLDYEYRSYIPYGSRGRMSENLTAAVNLSVNW